MKLSLANFSLISTAASIIGKATSSSSVDALDTIVKVDLPDRRSLNQSSVFGDYYKGSSAGSWCNVNAKDSRGPHVQTEAECSDAFDAFNDNDFTYLGTISASSPDATKLAQFFGENANIAIYQNGCYMRDGNSRRILNGQGGGGNPNSGGKYFAFIDNSNGGQPNGNGSIKPVCNSNMHVCVSSNPCENGGTCIRTGAETYKCSCNAGYYGDTCAESVCDGENCSGQGTCSVDGNGATVCSCYAGYSGNTCGTSGCDNKTCSSPGTDSVTCVNGVKECTCYPGYSGDTCGTSVCDNESCSGKGTCSVDNSGSAVCSCPAGYFGTTCQIEDKCFGNNNPCQNGNTCDTNQSNGSATCQCDVTQCLNDGTCDTTNGTCNYPSPTTAPVATTSSPTTAPVAATSSPATSSPTTAPVATTSSPTTAPVATTSSPTTAPVASTSSPATSSPTTAPVASTSSPTTAPVASTSSPTTAPVASTSSPTTAPVATTPNTPTTAPIASTSSPTTAPVASTSSPTTAPVASTSSPTTAPVASTPNTPTTAPVAAIPNIPTTAPVASTSSPTTAPVASTPNTPTAAPVAAIPNIPTTAPVAAIPNIPTTAPVAATPNNPSPGNPSNPSPGTPSAPGIPTPPRPICDGIDCSNHGKCKPAQIDGFLQPLCQCEDTFEVSTNGRDCVCPEETALDKETNRCVSIGGIDVPIISDPTASPVSEIEPYLIYAQCQFSDSGEQYCIQAMGLTPGSPLQPQPCNKHTPINQYFYSDSEDRIHSWANPSLCLTSDISARSVYLGECSDVAGSLAYKPDSETVGTIPLSRRSLAEPAGIAAFEILASGYVIGLDNDDLFGNFALFKDPDELDQCCETLIRVSTGTEAIPAPTPITPTAAPTPECQDVSKFTFELEQTGNTVDCSWLLKNNQQTDAKRTARYCVKDDVRGACKASCNSCSQQDDPGYEFPLKNDDSKFGDCDWISKKVDRRNRYCFSSADCLSASEIGLKCPDACGFTSGDTASTCTDDVVGIVVPSTPSPTKAPTKSPTISPTRAPTSTSTDDNCKDIDSFKFPLDHDSSVYADCEWLTKTNSSSRKAKYCPRGHVKGACQKSCESCGVSDDSSFSFELEKTNAEVSCDWISKNPSRREVRRSMYCFADDCESASDDVGNACVEACGFTEGMHVKRTCPPTEAPTSAPVSIQSISNPSPSAPSKGSPTMSIPSTPSAPSKGSIPTMTNIEAFPATPSAPSKGYLPTAPSAPSKGYTTDAIPSKGSRYRVRRRVL